MNIIKQLFTPNAVKQINAREFEDIRKSNSNAVVLDVRTDREFQQHNIPGALHINLQSRSFSDKIDELDKSKTYLVYCRSGRRSAMACKLMQNKGFQDCQNLSGGIMSWETFTNHSN